MPSATEPTGTPERSRGPGLRSFCERWNRKLHYYSGLFLLFFLWLFALSGLLLNHPEWTFHEHWQNRRETTSQRSIVAPPASAASDLDQAHDVMRQLQIEGDILWTTTRSDPAQLEFQVRRPGHFLFIKADWTQGNATVRYARVNGWGILKFLHVFTGNVADDPRNRRDWPLTYVWAYSMDAVAAALIFMVLSSVHMWLQLPQRRLAGAFALGAGCLCCALFCVGLRWMF